MTPNLVTEKQNYIDALANKPTRFTGIFNRGETAYSFEVLRGIFPLKLNAILAAYAKYCKRRKVERRKSLVTST